jgi:hypothetical protein
MMWALKTMISAAPTGAACKTTSPTRSRPIGRLSHGLAIAAALALAACAGGAGLDIPIGPVDHSCPVENSCGSHR